MKMIYEVKCMDYENNVSKSIVAYSDMKAAKNKMKKLNALYGENIGNPYFIKIKEVN